MKILSHAAFKYVVLIFLCALACAVLFMSNHVSAPAPFAASPAATLTIASTTIEIEYANTPELRTQGLSGRNALPKNSGLLFVFDTEERAGFWMKDMNFPIDILWIDESRTVVHIERAVTPESYPHIFYPAAKARYVLEVNAGFVEKHKITVGSFVVL